MTTDWKEKYKAEVAKRKQINEVWREQYTALKESYEELDAYKKEMVAFSESLTKRFDIPVSGNDGLQSLVIGLAAIKSIKENRPIKVSEIDYKQEISMIKKEMISKMMD